MIVRFHLTQPRPLPAMLSALSWALIVAGCCGLGLYLWSQGDQVVQQIAQREYFESAVPPAPAPVDRGGESARILPSLTGIIKPDPRIIGEIEIPRLGINAMIHEGVDAKTLRRFVGHVTGTAQPGSLTGNTVLAGHRDTLFRGLRGIGRGDLFYIRKRGGERFEYEVTSVGIVEPDAVEVMAPSEKTQVTLITCYPFDFVGKASRRFIVKAIPRSAADPGTQQP